MCCTDFEKQLIEWRHHIHMYPETAFEERQTAEYVARILRDMGLDVHTNIGKTGVVANLKVGDGTEVIGLRADMDAINLKEMGRHPYTSQNVGKMHGCGHDGHTATLLGAAKLLSERKNFNGTVRFIFQPAEEPGLGALAMMEDGLFQRFPVDEIYGLHNTPLLPEGQIHTRKGGLLSSEDDFVIRIKGQGAHASSPEAARDPLVTAAEIITALQTVVSRNVSPQETAVISCTELHTDGARNCIPSNVVITGDTRSYSPEIQELLEKRMRAICKHICEMHDSEFEFEYSHEFVPLINSPQCVDVAVKAAKNLVGEENVNSDTKPNMPSEDFARFLQKVPGCFVFIGSGACRRPADVIAPHNSLYDYNDNILKLGAEYFAELVRTRLAQL